LSTSYFLLPILHFILIAARLVARHLDGCEAFGRLLGCYVAHCCLRGGSSPVVFPVALTTSLLKMIVDAPILADDVRSLDEGLFRFRVDALLEEGGIAAVAGHLCEDALRFVDDGESPSELCPGGADMEVTPANLEEYVSAFAEHLLCGAVRREIAAFLRGVWAVVPLEAFQRSQLNAFDLALLLSGLPHIDCSDWQAHTVLDRSADVTETDAARRAAAFFAFVERCELEMRARVLQFATGLSRLSGGGFASLSPPFTLQMLGPPYAGRLPMAHTCFNLLALPPFESETALADALATSVPSGMRGFGLR